MTAAVPRLIIDEQNPWPGLSAFDEAAERFFNGRREESAALRRLVMQAPLTILFGASGLGKSSLVQAGLFPLLRKEHILPVYVRLDFGDRAAPLIDQVRPALERELRNRRVDAAVFHPGESLWESLHRAGLELWSAQNQLLTPLFVFDQFEEVFTLGAGNSEAVAKLRIDLADLIENRMPASLAERVRENETGGAGLSFDSQRYKVLLSFREDFLPAVEGWKREMPSIMRNRLRLLPMSGEQAFEAVHKTAPHLADEAMARRIVSFVAAAGEESSPESASELAVEPALLSLVCHGLNERRKAQRKTEFDGGLLQGTGQAIIADFYRHAVADLPQPVHRFIERELITERGFRKACDVDDARSVHGVTDRDLRLLVDRRLLRIEPARGTERVELTHDLLTRVVREHRDRQRVRERIEREERSRRRLTLVGAGLGAIILVLGWSYYRAEQATRRVEATLAELRRQTGIAEEATAGAVKSAAQAAAEARAALAHQLAGAAINAVAEGSSSALPFALHAVKVTRDVDGQVFLDAEDALRRVAAPLGIELPRLGHNSDITHIEFSPDGRRVATIGGDGVRIWDLAQAADILSFDPGRCSTIEFSRDWKKLACANPFAGESHVWDLETGKSIQTISSLTVTGGRAKAITRFGFSPDGKLFAGDENGVIVFDGSAAGKKFAGTGAVFSPDGKLLATAVGTELKVWDFASGNALRVFETNGRISSIVWSPDAKSIFTIFTNVLNASAALWNVTSGNTFGLGDVSCAAFRLGGSGLVKVSPPNILTTVDISSGVATERRQLLRAAGNVTGMNRCAFSPDGNSLITISGGAVDVWNLGLPRPSATRVAEGSVFAWKADSSAVASAIGNSAVVRNLRSGAVVELPGQDKSLKAQAFSPDRQRLVTAGSNRARVWDTNSGRRLLTLIGHEEQVDSIAYSPNGNLIATAGGDRVAKLWDARSGRFLRDLVNHQERIMDVAFSADSRRVATAGYDRTVRIWEAATGREVAPPSPIRQESAQFQIAFSADGKRFAFGGRQLNLWDAVALREISPVPANDLPAGLALSSDGVLAAVTPSGVQLWRQGSQWVKLPGSVAASVSQPVGIAFSHDGKRLVAPGNDAAIRIWDVEARKELTTLYTYTTRFSMRSVAFSPDEKLVYAVSEAWIVYRIPVAIDDLISDARKSAGNAQLTDADCLNYLHQQPCPATIRGRP